MICPLCKRITWDVHLLLAQHTMWTPPEDGLKIYWRFYLGSYFLLVYDLRVRRQWARNGCSPPFPPLAARITMRPDTTSVFQDYSEPRGRHQQCWAHRDRWTQRVCLLLCFCSPCFPLLLTLLLSGYLFFPSSKTIGLVGRTWTTRATRNTGRGENGCVFCFFLYYLIFFFSLFFFYDHLFFALCTKYV